MKDMKFTPMFDFIQIGGKAIDRIGKRVGEVIRIKSPNVYLEFSNGDLVKRHRLDVRSYNIIDN